MQVGSDAGFAHVEYVVLLGVFGHWNSLTETAFAIAASGIRQVCSGYELDEIDFAR